MMNPVVLTGHFAAARS